jgi:hypothetical protein
MHYSRSTCVGFTYIRGVDDVNDDIDDGIDDGIDDLEIMVKVARRDHIIGAEYPHRLLVILMQI